MDTTFLSLPMESTIEWQSESLVSSVVPKLPPFSPFFYNLLELLDPETCSDKLSKVVKLPSVVTSVRFELLLISLVITGGTPFLWLLLFGIESKLLLLLLLGRESRTASWIVGNRQDSGNSLKKLHLQKAFRAGSENKSPKMQEILNSNSTIGFSSLLQFE